MRLYLVECSLYIACCLVVGLGLGLKLVSDRLVITGGPPRTAWLSYCFSLSLCRTRFIVVALSLSLFLDPRCIGLS